jgi:hypothetical protein
MLGCEAALWHSIGTHGLVLGPALLAIMARFADVTFGLRCKSI